MQYVIFMAVVIALLVFAFILLTYTQQQFRLKTNNYVQTIHNSNLGIDYSVKKNLGYNEPFKIKFSEKLNDEITIIQERWGVFDVVKSTSNIKNTTFTKTALVGGFTNDKIALYLQDNNQPLVVVGTSKIEGVTKLPKQGVKQGSIAGNSYINNQLIYGSIGLSNEKLPKIENIEAIKALCQGAIQLNNTEGFELTDNLTFSNSFTAPTKIFKSFSSLDLQDITLTGNIIVQSNTAIKIYESASLTDVILIAPNIEVNDNVKGNFQALATKKITLGKNCDLRYPSSAVIYDKKNNQSSSIENGNQDLNAIFIDKNSEIKGIVCFLSENIENNFKPQITLEKNANVTGEVFCNGNFELKGSINGSVYTKGFIANEFGSVYQNHIYNGEILTKDFPNQYSGLFLEDYKKSVVKWLY